MHAGPFGAWLTAARASLRGEGSGLDVPCGDCVGCCTSSLFVHVAPDETSTLAVIPRRLLVRAPGRPRTCRDYDCRMLAAAGVEAGDGKDAINERVAAAFIRDERASFPGGAAPSSPDQIAVLALMVYELFLDGAARNPVETANAIVRLHSSE